MMHLLLLTALVLAGPGPAAAGSAPSPEPPAGLVALEAQALAAHPLLQASRDAEAGARARELKAGSLPDPRLRWSEMIEPVETRNGPQQRVLGVEQSLPWPGTLAAGRRSAEAGTRAAQAEAALQEVRVLARLRRAYVQAGWLAEVRRVRVRERDLLAELEQSVRAAYEGGQSRFEDLLRVQLERARVDDQLDQLDDRLASARARLNQAVGRDAGTALEMPGALPPMPGWADEAMALENHPALEALGQQARSAQLAARAAGAAGKPRLTLGLDWIQIGESDMAGDNSGHDAVAGKLGVVLPLWRGKHDGARQEAEARERMMLSRQRATSQGLQADAREAADRLASARRSLALHRDRLLPAARRILESTRAGYQSGTVNLDQVLQARRTLLDLDEQYENLRRDELLAVIDGAEALGARRPWSQ